MKVEIEIPKVGWISLGFKVGFGLSLGVGTGVCLFAVWCKIATLVIQ